MTTKHEGFTPGPWKFLKRGLIVTADESKAIGTFRKAHDNKNNDDKVILAAPDLLAENKRLRAALDSAATLLLQASRGRCTPDELSDAGYETRAALARKE